MTLYLLSVSFANDSLPQGTRPEAPALSTLILSLKHVFSPRHHRHLGLGHSSLWVGWFVHQGCLTASLASALQVANIFLVYDNRRKKCLQTLSNVCVFGRWCIFPAVRGEGRPPWLGATGVRATLCFQSLREEARKGKQLTLPLISGGCGEKD